MIPWPTATWWTLTVRLTITRWPQLQPRPRQPCSSVPHHRWVVVSLQVARSRPSTRTRISPIIMPCHRWHRWPCHRIRGLGWHQRIITIISTFNNSCNSTPRQPWPQQPQLQRPRLRRRRLVILRHRRRPFHSLCRRWRITIIKWTVLVARINAGALAVQVWQCSNNCTDAVARPRPYRPRRHRLRPDYWTLVSIMAIFRISATNVNLSDSPLLTIFFFFLFRNWRGHNDQWHRFTRKRYPLSVRASDHHNHRALASFGPTYGSTSTAPSQFVIAS